MFAEQYGPWALIAGGSEGIGAAFARRVAAEGVNVVLVARKLEPLEELAGEIRTTHGVDVRAASIDLTAADVGDQLAGVTAGCDIGLLVYNAGARDHHADLVDDPLEVSLQQVRLNCIGPVTLCHQFGGPMAARGRGGILLVSSMAALGGCAGIAVYSAGKAFDATLGEGLWYELRARGVHVLSLLAGTTDTPAMHRAGLVLDYAGLPPMDADDVAREGLEHLADGPRWIAGEHNRRAVDAVATTPRAQLVEARSVGTAKSFGLPT